MFTFSVDEVRRLMNETVNIRHVGVIAECNLGQHNIVDLLVNEVGIKLPEDANERMSNLARIRPINVKAVPSPLYVRMSCGGETKDATQDAQITECLVNLIDLTEYTTISPVFGCPAFHNVDSVLVVVDLTEGLSPRSEKVLKHALSSLVKPIIFIDNLERIFMKDTVALEDLYQSLSRTVDAVNAVVSQWSLNAPVDLTVSPISETVIFGSTSHGWAFSLNTFASKYAKKFDVHEQKTQQRMWGESFFHEDDKVWRKTGSDSQRGFNQFIMGPISRIYSASGHDTARELGHVAAKLGVQLTQQELGQSGTDLLKTMMQQFLPFTDTVTTSLVRALPSPISAQLYRAEVLYSGPSDDEVFKSIANCDPQADLVIFISQMIPATDKAMPYAIGRVFSGTVQPRLKVRIQDVWYASGGKGGLFVKAIPNTVLTVGQVVEPIEDVPAGNFVSIVGISEYLHKTGTITTWECGESMRRVSPSTPGVVCRSVGIANPEHLPQFIRGLKQLAQYDYHIEVFVVESGDHVIRGISEEHLEMRCNELEKYYAGVQVDFSKPYVAHRESVAARSSMVALAKSPNRYSRLWAAAEPLGDELSQAIEEQKVASHGDIKTRAHLLAKDYGWNESEARKIWTFGPDRSGPNILVDMTKNVQYLHEIRDSTVSAFQWATKEGPLAEEPMRSIRFNLTDVGLFADAIHRGGGQIIPAARRVVYAAALLADPILCEPVYQVEIRAPQQSLVNISTVLEERRGRRFSEQYRLGIYTPLYAVKAYLPVAESFGFTCALRQATDGQASQSMVFDHWQAIPGGSPLDPTTSAGKTAIQIRQRKGILTEVPSFSKFHDPL